MTGIPSFPRKREPSDFRRTHLASRLRVNDEPFSDAFTHIRNRPQVK
jgi:hypothetical protein